MATSRQGSGGQAMAVIDFEALLEPVSEAAACGPDLDLDGDPDFMNFVARAEGVLPASFFVRDPGDPDSRLKLFDRSSIDVAAQIEAIRPLLAATRDLRLLVILAKLLIIDRDLAGFAGCLRTIGALLAQRWEEVHPQLVDDDAGFRMAVLQTLDDLGPVVMPLQHVPLVESRRLGPVTYRMWLIAKGEAKPQEWEDAVDVTAVEHAFAEADLPALIGTRDALAALRDALRTIRAAWVDHAGFDQAVSFDRLAPVTERMLDLLDQQVARRDPSARLAPDAGASSAAAAAPAAAVAAGPVTVAAGAVQSAAAAAAALAAVAAYFDRFEPSSPAVLLVRQAEQLMGKSFLEVMRVLFPAHADQAAIELGGAQPFELPLERLSAFAPDGGGYDGGAAVAEEAAQAGNGDMPDMTVRSRQDAIALLAQIGAYFRAAEPSSPLPLLTERARSLAERDFLALLKDVLPPAAFKQPNTES